LCIATFVVVVAAIEARSNNDTATATSYYNYPTACFFAITGIACTVMLLMLIHMIRKTFVNELDKE
jgi:hypothetical protein